MSTLTEILLVIVISILTITLAIIGVQVFLILRDIRSRIFKLDPILDNVIMEQQYLNEILVSAKSTTQRVNDTTIYLSNEVVKPIGSLVAIVKSINQFVNHFREKRFLKQKYLEEDYHNGNSRK